MSSHVSERTPTMERYICTSSLPHRSHVMIRLGNRTHLPYYLVAIMLD